MKELPPTCDNKIVLSSLQKKIETDKNRNNKKVSNQIFKELLDKDKSSSTFRSEKYPRVKQESQSPYTDKE